MFRSGEHELVGPTAPRRSRDRGASLVEYALVIALIALVCIGAVSFLGSATDSSVDGSASSLFLP